MFDHMLKTPKRAGGLDQLRIALTHSGDGAFAAIWQKQEQFDGFCERRGRRGTIGHGHSGGQVIDQGSDWKDAPAFMPNCAAAGNGARSETHCQGRYIDRRA